MAGINVDIRRAAMDLLARREHSKRELLYKIRKRFPSETILIEDAIETLNQEGLQSDRRLAEAFLRSRANGGQGPMKIRSELKTKGVKDEDINRAFADCAIDWCEQVTSVASKRFGELGPENAKERAKRSRFLQQRGFSFDEIATLY